MTKTVYRKNAVIILPIIIGLSIFIIAVLSAYVVQFWGRKLGEPEAWGTFGDYLGGTLNPVLGFATMVIVVMTYQLQQRQLILTREALTLQSTATKEAAELTALTAALDALNIMIATKAGPDQRSTVGTLLAISRREAIIRRIIAIADIEVETGRDIQYPDYSEKDELS